MSLSKLQELLMDRKAWSATLHRVTESWTLVSNWTEVIAENNQMEEKSSISRIQCSQNAENGKQKEILYFREKITENEENDYSKFSKIMQARRVEIFNVLKGNSNLYTH